MKEPSETEQMAHEPLRAIVDHYNAIMNSTNEAIIRKSMDGVITGWSRGAESIFGYMRNEMIGQTIQRLLPDDRLDDESRVFARIKQDAPVKTFDTVRIRKDGERVHVSVSVSPISDDLGNVTGVSTIARDRRVELEIEETRRTLADSEARFRGAFETAAHGMALVSIEGRFIKVNQSLCNMLGYSQGALLQIGFQNITHPDDLETDLGFVQDLLQGRLNHYDMEKRYFHKKGGIIWVLLSVSLLRSGAGDPIHFVSQIQDITERKKLEQQLRQSQKMEMLGQLTGGIAHDFNNLLAVIQLNLGMIRERLRDDPEADEMAGESLEAIKRGANLTDQLLAFARRQSLQPEAVNIGTLVSGMASLLRRTLGETINITTNIPAGLWATKIDPHKLENALLNLALNSLHAMTEGGSVVLEASNTVLDEFYVAKHLDVLPGDYVMVTVTDTGVGMSPDVLERALEPFFTTKPVGKGSGLGLSMVLGFVKQSGGHLTIDSEPGRGVRVNLYLPRASGEASHVTATHYQEIPPPAPGEMVLVVEDDQVLRGLALRILNDLGYQTIGAEDGPTALTILDSADHVDLLLTDVVLPKGMNGPELARRVRSRRPAAKVLFMSGYPRDAAFGDGGPEDSAQILTKPFSKEELVYMVRKTMVERNES